MKISTKILFLASLILALFATAQASTYDDYVFFGDSLTDTGNSACNTNRVDIGCGTWAEYLTWNKFGTYATPSNQGGNNYAVSGSTSADALDQVSQYLNAHGKKADPNAYYFILTGANDVITQASSYIQQIQTDFTHGNYLGILQVLQTAFLNIDPWLQNPGGPVYNVVKAVAELQQSGAQHIMVIDMENPSNVPMVQNYLAQIKSACGLAPTPTLKNTCLTAVYPVVATFPDVFARNYNGTLESALSADASTAKSTMFSMYTLSSSLISTGQFHACTAGSSGCVNGMFWDDRHPVAPAHAAMAKAVQAMIDTEASVNTDY